MEEAEENTYLAENADGQGLEEKLKAAFPKQREIRALSEMSNMSYWQALVDVMPDEESDFELLPPYTMEKASAFYKHLLKTDQRRRNPKRPDAAPAISRKSVYHLMIAAFELYDRKHAANGALQNVKPPSSADERLLVCGDTHGQLQDVLWIFDEHGQPSAKNAFLFNGDIADRGRDALEILLLLLSYQLADERCLYINRGNHEQRDLNERPFAQGGGFAWEVRAKYPHDENLVELFQRFFNSIPIAATVGEWAFVIHGGLFREPNITLEDVRKINNRRAPPQALKTYDDNLLFDALWADPHAGLGVKIGTTRGAFSATFGADVTKEFCQRNGIKSIVRSHQLPKQRRGFEIQHDSMLLTIFSASNYGGACRNKGGVLIFDQQGPAEVKEFYAPPLDQLRQMVEFRAAEKLKDQIEVWKRIALSGSSKRNDRQQQRDKRSLVQVGWRHLLLEVNEMGNISAEDQAIVDDIEAAWKTDINQAADDGNGVAPPLIARSRSVINGGGGAANTGRASSEDSGNGGYSPMSSSSKTKAMRRRTLQTHLIRSVNEDGSLRRSEPAAVPNADTSDEFTHGVVFVEEEDQGQRTDGDIMNQLLAELCKNRNALVAAFVAAEQAESDKSARPQVAEIQKQKSVMSLRRNKSGMYLADSSNSGSDRSHGKGDSIKIPYETWVGVLAKQFPEYGALWQQYGPKLVGSAAYPPLHTTGGRPVAGCRVAYVQFLNRFQVTLAYETFDSFHQALLSRLFDRLLERTRQMPMRDLFAYFDPDHSGSVESTELEQALSKLDLGLTPSQLQQLILTLGFDERIEVDPLEALTCLLERLGPVVRRSAHTAGSVRAKTLTGNEQEATTFAPNEVQRAMLEGQVSTLALMIQSKLPTVMAALGGQTIQALFAKADADGSGVLEREEAKDLIREIQTCVGLPVFSTEEELENLVKYIDLDGNGHLSFVEFLVAFGTTASQSAAPAATLEAAQAPRDEIVQGLTRQVCSALFERMHLLQRAFAYLDVHGDGWVPVSDFEQAITLVMSLPPPSKAKTAAADASSSASPIAVSVDAAQIAALVASLRGSALLDDQKDPPQIDWTGFIQAFEVVDTEPE